LKEEETKYEKDGHIKVIAPIQRCQRCKTIWKDDFEPEVVIGRIE
jgi:hypothetical protein